MLASEWLDRWSDTRYTDFVHVMADYVATTKKMIPLRSPIVFSKTKKESYHIVPPIFGDAQDDYAIETDPARKEQIGLYINIMRQQTIAHNKAIVRERELMPNADAIRHVMQYGIVSPYALSRIVYIKELPTIQIKSIQGKPPKKSPKRNNNKEYKDKPSNVKSPKRISPDSKDKLKEHALNQILSKSFGSILPFKTHVECLSRATKQKYYISKPDLIKIIKENPSLTRKVGTKIASLTKEEICDKIFAPSIPN